MVCGLKFVSATKSCYPEFRAYDVPNQSADHCGFVMPVSRTPSVSEMSHRAGLEEKRVSIVPFVIGGRISKAK